MAKTMLVFNNKIYGEDVAPVKCMYAPSGLGCCPFQGGGSVAVDSLFCVTSHCVWGFWVWSLFCYAILCVLSHFAIILKRKRESWFLCFNLSS